MMKASFKLERPEDSMATITMTMTIGEWSKLLNQAVGHQERSKEFWKFSGLIKKLIRHAEEHFSETVEPEA